ncbi:uncharacterized protein LOC136093231 [Hydra vulgaris]|uniref:uncharacterized protein LOC136093231 n=1 Tax=Hydra vulgaris TaxID=6087 RepID=UPI0032EA61B9
MLSFINLLFKGEDIDGNAFLQMNSVLFHCIGIKMGQAIKLQSIIAAEKEQSTDFVQTECLQTDFTVENNLVSPNQTSSSTSLSTSNPFSDSTHSRDSDVLHTPYPVLRIDNIKFVNFLTYIAVLQNYKD